MGIEALFAIGTIFVKKIVAAAFKTAKTFVKNLVTEFLGVDIFNETVASTKRESSKEKMATIKDFPRQTLTAMPNYKRG